MSRVGSKPITIPAGVDVKVEGQLVKVKGKLGQLERRVHPSLQVAMADGAGVVKRPDDSRTSKALHGLERALINNNIVGVSEGFSKTLLIEGVGYRVMAKGKSLEFSLGYSHQIHVDPPEGITFKTAKPTELVIEGIDKQLVGQVAANIRKFRKPEPYKGKGIRYSGEYVRRKAGKAAVK